MKDKITKFFKAWEEAWSAIPGYVKVFIYATSSSIVGVYASTGMLDTKTIIFIVLANLGIYQGTRSGASQIKKIIE